MLYIKNGMELDAPKFCSMAYSTMTIHEDLINHYSFL